MADVSDVCNTLVGIIAGTLYPNGTGNASINGVPARVFYGWPIPETLQADLAAGTCQVSIYPRADERNTSRYPTAWQTTVVNTATLSVASVAGSISTTPWNFSQSSVNFGNASDTFSGITGVPSTVTIAGTSGGSSNPQNVLVTVNYVPYVYGVQTTDTPTTIATALTTLIAANVAGTTSSGATITLPTGVVIGRCAVGISGSSVMEVRRQEKVFQITVWANTPGNRDLMAQAIDPVLAQTRFLTLPDLTGARLIYKSTMETDDVQKAQVYRRDLFYTVEYATTVTQINTQILVTELTVLPLVSGSAAAAPASQVIVVPKVGTAGAKFNAASNSQYAALPSVGGM